jgi:hypothetical protein
VLSAKKLRIFHPPHLAPNKNPEKLSSLLWRRALTSRVMRSTPYIICFLLFFRICAVVAQIEDDSNKNNKTDNDSGGVQLSLFSSLPPRKKLQARPQDCKGSKVWSSVAKRCILPNGKKGFGKEIAASF